MDVSWCYGDYIILVGKSIIVRREEMRGEVCLKV